MKYKNKMLFIAFGCLILIGSASAYFTDYQSVSNSNKLASVEVDNIKINPVDVTFMPDTINKIDFSFENKSTVDIEAKIGINLIIKDEFLGQNSKIKIDGEGYIKDYLSGHLYLTKTIKITPDKDIVEESFNIVLDKDIEDGLQGKEFDVEIIIQVSQDKYAEMGVTEFDDEYVQIPGSENMYLVIKGKGGKKWWRKRK